MLRHTACLVAILAAGCGPTGYAPGHACVYAKDCASNLCLTVSATQHVCAAMCVTTADCNTGQICGQFEFSVSAPDSGTVEGPVPDQVSVCRPPLNAPCSDSTTCASGLACIGAPSGVCTATCTQDSDCLSNACLLPLGVMSMCGVVQSGLCAPTCDDPMECPHLWYCNTAYTDVNGDGRCQAIEGDAATAMPQECGPDE